MQRRLTTPASGISYAPMINKAKKEYVWQFTPLGATVVP